MAVPQRGAFIPSVWADNAQTSIPVPPVKGIGYRNANLGPNAFTPGQLYGSIGDSSTWNQYLNQLSSVAQAQERYGIAPYCPSTDYGLHALVLWTNGRMYQAISDPPAGTPCTNTTYWEEYTPATVIPTPPISATAGLTLYVNYGKTSSGDGLTAATAFKNFTDCFTAMRTKFASANGVFTSSTWVPLFKIIATGPGTSVTVEPGIWRLQNINVEIQFNRDFSMPSTEIYVTGSVIRFAGTGSCSLRTISVDTSTITWSVNSYFVNSNSGSNGGVGAWVRNSNMVVDSGRIVQFTGTVGMNAAGLFMDVLGTLNIRSTSSGAMGQVSLSDIYVAGTMSWDSNGANMSNLATLSLAGSNLRVHAGTLRLRQPELVGGLLMVVNGNLVLGSQTSAPQYGIICRGGFVYMVNSSVNQASVIPQNKGAVTVGGSVEGGRPAANWPGTGDWVVWGNGYYSG